MYSLFSGAAFYNIHDLHFMFMSCLENERGHQDFIKHEATQKVT